MGFNSSTKPAKAEERDFILKEGEERSSEDEMKTQISWGRKKKGRA